MHSNVTRWSTDKGLALSALAVHTECGADILCVCETHVPTIRIAGRYGKELRRRGWECCWGLSSGVTESGEATVAGTGGGSGGVLIAWRVGLSVVMVTESMWADVLQYVAKERRPIVRSRLAVVVVHLSHGVAITLIELYLHVGEELCSAQNLLLWQTAHLLCRLLGNPVLLLGDLQADAQEVLRCPLLAHFRWARGGPWVRSTCASRGGGRCIDHYLGSCRVLDLVVADEVHWGITRPHGAVSVLLNAKPRSVRALTCMNAAALPEGEAGEVLRWDPAKWSQCILTAEKEVAEGTLMGAFLEARTDSWLHIWSRAAELYTCAVTAGEHEPPRRGRGMGNCWRWLPLFNRRATGPVRGSSCGGGWRRILGLLRRWCVAWEAHSCQRASEGMEASVVSQLVSAKATWQCLKRGTNAGVVRALMGASWELIAKLFSFSGWFTVEDARKLMRACDDAVKGLDAASCRAGQREFSEAVKASLQGQDHRRLAYGVLKKGATVATVDEISMYTDVTVGLEKWRTDWERIWQGRRQGWTVDGLGSVHEQLRALAPQCPHCRSSNSQWGLWPTGYAEQQLLEEACGPLAAAGRCPHDVFGWQRQGCGGGHAMRCGCLLKQGCSGGLSVKGVRDVAKHYPSRKSKGTDQWRAAEIAQLPDKVLVWLVAWMRCCQLRGSWPDSVRTNLMALLPKPGRTDKRCVAKTAMVYRLWCGARRDAVRRYEVEHMAEWDKSRPGASALTAAYERSIDMERGVLSKQAVGAMLWDFEKFFDTINVATVLAEGELLTFPLTDLVLGLDMHLAPRRLQVHGVVSQPITVLGSILPGCALAIPFTRIFMRRAYTAILDAPLCATGQAVIAKAMGLARKRVGRLGCREALQRPRGVLLKGSLYVDDAVQWCRGMRWWEVCRALCTAVWKLLWWSRQLGLIISPKSTVVTNVAAIGIAVEAIGSHFDVSLVMSGGGTRDLGVLCHAKGCRLTRLQAPRVMSMLARLRTIGWMRKFSPGSCMLRRGGAFSVGLYGCEVIGVSPPVLRGLEASYTAAGPVGGSQRCPTACGLLFGGRTVGGEVQYRLGVAWREYLGAHPITLGFRAYWRRCWDMYSSLPQDKMWQQVVGPVGALMITLRQDGWSLPTVTAWLRPQAGSLVIHMGSPRWWLGMELLRANERASWARAACHWSGNGLAEGVDTRLTLKACTDLLCPRHMSTVVRLLGGALRCIMGGGWWDAARIGAKLNVCQTCPWCGAARPTSAHVWWTCPALNNRTEDAICDTQDLVGTASTGIQEGIECFWLRGLVPRLYTVLPHCAEATVSTVGNAAQLAAVRYYTDGSGGAMGSHPALRRCGVGLAVMGEDGQFLAGAYCALPGWEQTVPRAELMAVILALELASQCSPVHIVTDASTVSSGIDTRRKGGGNWDLWSRVWQLTERKKLRLTVNKVTSHVLDGGVRPGRCVDGTIWDCVGNVYADAMAERGSAAAALPPAAVNTYCHTETLTARVQRRLATLGGIMASSKEPRVAPPDDGALSDDARWTRALVERSAHRVTRSSTCWWCPACHTGVAVAPPDWGGAASEVATARCRYWVVA